MLPKTPEGRAAAFGAGCLGALAAIVVGAFLVSRSDWYRPARKGFLSKKPVTGRVVDHVSGAPIAGVSVEVTSTGYDLAHGGMLTSLHAEGISGNDGRFELALRRLGRPKLTATKVGYVPSRDYWMDTRAVTIPMVPATAGRNEARHAFPTLIYHSASDVFGIDIVRRDIVEDGHLRISLEENASLIRLVAGRGAVIRYVPGGDIPGAADVVENECVAPDSGYVSEIDLHATDPQGICFIKTEDGKYGSVILSPQKFPAFVDSIHGSPVNLRLHFNVGGGRGLCSERTGSSY